MVSVFSIKISLLKPKYVRFQNAASKRVFSCSGNTTPKGSQVALLLVKMWVDNHRCLELTLLYCFFPHNQNLHASYHTLALICPLKSSLKKSFSLWGRLWMTSSISSQKSILMSSVIPISHLINLIQSLSCLTSTTWSTNSFLTKIPTLFLAIVLPKYHNLCPSISKALALTHLVSCTHVMLTLCLCKVLTNSIDLLVRVPIFQDAKYSLSTPSFLLTPFPPKDKLGLLHYSPSNNANNK